MRIQVYVYIYIYVSMCIYGSTHVPGNDITILKGRVLFIGCVPIACNLRRSTRFASVGVLEIRHQSLLPYHLHEMQVHRRNMCYNCCMLACLPACMYACMHASTHACMHACMHVCTQACMHACMHACTQACTHACMHTNIHTYIHAGGKYPGIWTIPPLHSSVP